MKTFLIFHFLILVSIYSYSQIELVNKPKIISERNVKKVLFFYEDHQSLVSPTSELSKEVIFDKEGRISITKDVLSNEYIGTTKITYDSIGNVVLKSKYNKDSLLWTQINEYKGKLKQTSFLIVGEDTIKSSQLKYSGELLIEKLVLTKDKPIRRTYKYNSHGKLTEIFENDALICSCKYKKKKVSIVKHSQFNDINFSELIETPKKLEYINPLNQSLNSLITYNQLGNKEKVIYYNQKGKPETIYRFLYDHNNRLTHCRVDNKYNTNVVTYNALGLPLYLVDYAPKTLTATWTFVYFYN